MSKSLKAFSQILYPEGLRQIKWGLVNFFAETIWVGGSESTISYILIPRSGESATPAFSSINRPGKLQNLVRTPLLELFLAFLVNLAFMHIQKYQTKYSLNLSPYVHCRPSYLTH